MTVRLVALALIASGLIACAVPGVPGAPSTPTPPPRIGELTRDDLQAAINAVQGDPHNFAGVWWDANGWPLHIAYVSDDPAMRAKVEEWLPPGAPVQWHRVVNSYAVLDDIQNEMVTWWNSSTAAERADVGLDSTGIYVSQNVVRVALVRHSPGFEAEWLARFPTAIEFTIEPRGKPLICDFPVSDSTPEFCLDD